MKLISLYCTVAIWFYLALAGLCMEYRTFHQSSGSPFASNKDLLQRKFLQLVEKNEGIKALALVKSIIMIEKAWRQRFCTRVFGVGDCSRKIESIDPFYLWKRKMIFELRKDPTREIFTFFRHSLSLLQ